MIVGTRVPLTACALCYAVGKRNSSAIFSFVWANKHFLKPSNHVSDIPTYYPYIKKQGLRNHTPLDLCQRQVVWFQCKTGAAHIRRNFVTSDPQVVPDTRMKLFLTSAHITAQGRSKCASPVTSALLPHNLTVKAVVFGKFHKFSRHLRAKKVRLQIFLGVLYK
jgi:hypothetical protein